ATRPLVIDPVITFSTFLGGSDLDSADAVDVQPATKHAFIAGITSSAMFPGTSLPPGGFSDAFVTRLDASGNLVYSVFLGGKDDEEAFGIAVDSSGVATVAGTTSSENFPILNAFDKSGPSGSFDAFVTRIAANGALVYSTYLGGGARDEA